jgi:hypothetical protein
MWSWLGFCYGFSTWVASAVVMEERRVEDEC